MSADECIHGLGPVAACTICNGREARERAEANRVVGRIHARYASVLACGHMPEFGDLISQMGDGRWLCDECAP